MSSFYKRRLPHQSLRRHIDSYWCYDGYHPAHHTERVLPSNTVELVVSLWGELLEVVNQGVGVSYQVKGQPLLSGPLSSYSEIPTRGQQMLLGVHFRPEGARDLLRIPISELRDQHIGLDELRRHKSDVEWFLLQDRLRNSANHNERFHLLDEIFQSRLAQSEPSPPALLHAIRVLSSGIIAEEPVSVASLAHEAGWSHRHFISRFQDFTGLTPTIFRRISRFQRALSALGRFNTPDWSQLALDSGYFDQSHMIHDFHEFSGCTPRALHRYRLSTSLDVPIPEQGQILPIRPTHT